MHATIPVKVDFVEEATSDEDSVMLDASISYSSPLSL